MATQPPTTLLYSYQTDLSPILAQRIIQDNQKQLPLLDNIVILMPNYHASTRLRQALTQQAHKLGFNALLGPQIYTLKDYIEKNTLLDKQRIPSDARELILMQALEENRNLFGDQNLLTIAEALLELFDELTRYQITLPESIDDFITQLEAAYQCDNLQISALSQEATIVHTLWQAWHTQLNADNIADLETHYQLKLSKNLQQENNTLFYIVGYYEFLPSELQWINTKREQNKATLFFHGQSNNYGLHPATVLHTLFSELKIKPKKTQTSQPACDFLDAVYLAPSNTCINSNMTTNKEQQFNDRANAIKNAYPSSPISNSIKTFEGTSFEEEAKAIEIQVRIWMTQNKKHIALIIEDRMLARRVRALLDQSGIGLKDMEGWALSTSSAASIIESWLQTIEENFHHLPLLDVIKSPFSLSNLTIDPETIYRFEQDIVRHENISSDINRFKKACAFRQHRLNIHNAKNSDNIISLLNHIERSAAPLTNLLDKNKSLSYFLNALTSSLDTLGCTDHLNEDVAGESLMTLLQTLKENVTVCDIEMDWLGFRHWLGKKLEGNTFKPISDHKYYVELLHLTQSSLGHYEALIIGSMVQDSYPGSAKQTPFFNQSVRIELNLPAPQNQIQTKFYHFRRLLESAPHVLLTMHSGAQENLSSPWLTLLKSFHLLAYNQTLENEALHHWINDKTENNDLENILITSNKKAIINPQQLPDSISASGHQTLVNCPYAFFAAQVLKLRAPDEIRDTLAKSDYGERVHLCLHAFHSGESKNLLGPFQKKIDIENRIEAIEFLTKISDQVFSKDIEDNFQHRGWHKRWLQQIPKYIDWQINYEKNWSFKAGEFSASQTLRNGLTLNGRIDRMDRSRSSKEGDAVVDYKTGRIPKIDDVVNGEAVQLAHYALSSEADVTHIEYLLIEDPKKMVVSKCELEKEDLAETKHQTEERLITMYQSMKDGHSLEAWGTEDSCQYCSFKGLCRKQFR